MPKLADQIITITPQERLFNPVNDLLIIVSAFAHASSVIVGGSTHTTPTPTMRITTTWANYGFALPLRGPLEHALDGTSPTSIDIGIITNPDTLAAPLPNIRLQTGGLKTIYGHISSPIFILFFERYNDWLFGKYGEGINWHPTLNFARVIRNACAHGSINIRNPSTPNVRWRGFEFGHKDNGSKIIGEKLKLGEVIALMIDVNSELDALGVPVL